jgi:Carboxypeptidase regulatory-like domain
MSGVANHQHERRVEAVALPLCVAVLVSAVGGATLRAQRPTTPGTSSVSDGTPHANANGLTPQNPLEKHISIMLIDEPLSRALAIVAAQAGVSFTYSSDDLPPAKRVSLSRQDVSVGTALQLVLAGTRLHPVAMQDGAVVLTDGGMHPTADAPAMPDALVLTGRVIDPDGSPVPGAAIGLVGTGDTTIASDSGRFRIRGIVPGAYVLWARQVGFGAHSMPITVAARPSPVTVTLLPTVATLPAVTTTQPHPGYHEVGFDQRVQGGMGEFMTYEQIVQSHATRVTQLLQRLPGVMFGELPWADDGTLDANGSLVVNGPQHVGGEVNGMWLQGSCVAIAIDGVAQGVLEGQDIDNLLEPSDVGAIEVYGASERPGPTGPGIGGAGQTPLTLVGHWNSVQPPCALVTIWTRQRLGLPPADARSATSDTARARSAPEKGDPQQGERR